MPPTFLILAYDGDPFPQLKDSLVAQGAEFEPRYRGKDPLTFDPARHAGLILLGDYAEISQEEEDCFATAMDADKPILGICAGCHVISQALGGTICRHDSITDKRNPIEIYFTSEGVQDPVIQHLIPHPFTIQENIYTASVPPHGTMLAVSSNMKRPHCEAFRFGKFIYALQFHPEVSPESFHSKNDPWSPATLNNERLKAVCAVGRKVLDAWVNLALNR